MFNPEIYRAYDIRGIFPTDFNGEEAYHLGRAYAEFTRAKKVVVARDMRPSGDEIEPELIRGLTEGGVDVISIGLATSPLFYFAVHKLRVDGGLMVTASHNPGAYNGVKLTRAEAVPISGDNGIYQIRDLVEKRSWSEISEIGSVSKAEVTDEYINMATEGCSAAGLKIVVDAGNGMTGHILPRVFEKIGGEVIPLYWELDGDFPNHEADPLKEENMVDLQARVKEEQADLGVAFDGDGDRVFFCTEQGVTIPGDITTAIIAESILQEHPGTPVVFDIRSSRTTAEVIKEAGGEPIMWKVGHSLIKPKMREVNAHFAGEVSGHFFFAPWYADSGILTLNYFLRVIQQQDQPVSRFIASYLRYVKSPEINFEVADKQAVIQQLREKYSDAEQVRDFDGIRFDYQDWWASIRPSNTEPKLRLNMEAKTSALLAEKQAELEAIITKS